MSSDDRMGNETGGADFRVGPWLVCPELNQIRKNGKQVDLQNLSMQVLVYLAARQGEVISKNELVEKLWRGRVVGDDAVHRRIADLRRHLGRRQHANPGLRHPRGTHLRRRAVRPGRLRLRPVRPGRHRRATESAGRALRVGRDPRPDRRLAGLPHRDPEQHRGTPHGPARGALDPVRRLRAALARREAVEDGNLQLHGAWFKIGPAELHWRDPDTGAFAAIEA